MNVAADRIVADAAIDCVGTLSAIDFIGTQLAISDVVPRAAEDQVVEGVGFTIGAGIGIKARIFPTVAPAVGALRVTKGVTKQNVVAVATFQGVVAHSTDEQVFASATVKVVIEDCCRPAA